MLSQKAYVIIPKTPKSSKIQRKTLLVPSIADGDSPPVPPSFPVSQMRIRLRKGPGMPGAHSGEDGLGQHV